MFGLISLSMQSGLKLRCSAHEAMESIGLIEKGLTKKIRDKLKDIIFDEARISEIESKTHHDVIAFLTFISEKIGENKHVISIRE